MSHLQQSSSKRSHGAIDLSPPLFSEPATLVRAGWAFHLTAVRDDEQPQLVGGGDGVDQGPLPEAVARHIHPERRL